MKNIILISMILTLSSCVVSKKTYDDMCKKNCELTEQLKNNKAISDAKEREWKEAYLKISSELKALKDTTKVIEIVPHDPANE